MACLQIYRELLSLATLLRVHSKSKELTYLYWQNGDPSLKTTCHIRLKFFLWPKLLESLLLADYLVSVAVTLKETLKSFFPNFCQVFVDANHPLRELDCTCTRLLRLEITSHILGYITRATCSIDVVHFDYNTKFQPKIKSVAAYLSGYVFWSILSPNMFPLKKAINIQLNIDNAFCFADW